VEVEAKVAGKTTVEVSATVKARAQTGVEMEALTAVSTALLTLWDMVKQYEKDAAGQYPTTAIENIHVVKKVKQV
jgi:cyclic pyranopterin phosphate synthase